MIEVSGVPCSGKSTILSSKSNVVHSGRIYKDGRVRYNRWLVRIVFIIFGFTYLLFRVNNFLLLINFMNKTKFKFLWKFMAIINSIEKFGMYVIYKNNQNIYIDEGISHIPFILQLNNDDIAIFIKKFSLELASVNITFIPPPDFDTLMSRIMIRGHKKVSSKTEAKEFITLNLKIYKNYIHCLKADGEICFQYM